MKRLLLGLSFLISYFSFSSVAAQGWPSQYGGVMLQGFYWDSYDDSQWSVLEQQAADLAATFDLVWLPQSGNCGGQSMGYDDLYWFPGHYDSSFGTEAQLRSLIKTFKENGIKTIADVVINHRKSLTSWTDFPAEEYKGVTYQMTYNDICSDDEAARNGYKVGPNKDTGEGWDGMRDLDHKSENVQKSVKAYLDMLLNDMGYAGYRYDMVKGYAGSYTKQYNEQAMPEFSVGECWDGTNTIRNWIDAAGKTSAAFDFQFRYTVRNAINQNNWLALERQNDGNWPLVSTKFQEGAYKRFAVTFVENHDTEKRSNAAQDPIKKDTLAANAYLLSQPGTPCVFLTHWQACKRDIAAMAAARKLVGIHNESNSQKVAGNANFYATETTGTKSKLLCVVGPLAQEYIPDVSWKRILAGYHYVYCLPRALNTAWTDMASGTYEGEQQVRLVAVAGDNNVKLVYTTDGSTPTTSSTSVADGSTVTIPLGTTTLKVGIVLNGQVTGIISRSYTVKQKQSEQQVEIPSFCVVNDGEMCAFYEAPATWTATIKCWAWNDKENFTGGTWPGVECTLLGTASNGNKVWKWTYNGTLTTKPTGIIFNNNGSPQTADLPFENGGYYTKDGLKGNATGIDVIEYSPLTIDQWYDLQGRKVNQPKQGLYIQNGRKVLVK